MNWLDYALISVMVIGIILGLLTGPLWQVYRICSVVMAFIAAFLLYRILGGILSGIFSPETSIILGGAIIFGIILILTYVIGNLFKFFLRNRKFGIGGRLLGGGFAFIKTVLTCCIIISGVSFMENSKTGVVINNSLIAHNLDKGTKAVFPTIHKSLKEILPGEEYLMLKTKTINEGSPNG